jgi:hypothetical protein
MARKKALALPLQMKFKGTLTLWIERGVVYFHDEKGECLLRLEGLPTPLPNPMEEQIDVRHMKGVAWKTPNPMDSVFRCTIHPGSEHNQCPPQSRTG